MHSHDNTVCDAQAGAGDHIAILRIAITSGAGTLGDGKKIGLWNDQRTYIGAYVDQSFAGVGEGFYVEFDVDGATHEFDWLGGPESRDIEFTEEMRYAVGVWQGDGSNYQTIAVTPEL